MLYLMLWIFSENALINIAFYYGIFAIGFTMLLFFIEKCFLPKEIKISGKIYTVIWIVFITIDIISTLWIGHGSRSDKNKMVYPEKQPTKITDIVEVKQQGNEIEAARIEKYNQESKKKEKELQQESEDYFNKLMKHESMQREKEK